MSYKEIAVQLNISPKTVDYRIQQALKQLRIELKDYLPLIYLLFTWKYKVHFHIIILGALLESEY